MTLQWRKILRMVSILNFSHRLKNKPWKNLHAPAENPRAPMHPAEKLVCTRRKLTKGYEFVIFHTYIVRKVVEINPNTYNKQNNI